VQRGPSSPAERGAGAVAAVVSRWAGGYLIASFYSGSYAKGTAVTTGNDIDVFFSLASDTPGTLKDAYNGVYGALSLAGFQVRTQNVSLRAAIGTIHVDAVPGKVQVGFRNYHSLYKSKKDSWAQTNVQLHVQTVIESGRIEEIQAIKIWRDLHRLDWPSFYLELTVIDALKYYRSGQLATNVWRALEYIAQDFANARVVDPANSNNVISDDLSQIEKALISGQALVARSQQNWNKIIW